MCEKVQTLRTGVVGMLRRLVFTMAATVAIATALAATASAGPDPLAGVWVAHDVAGDGSTDRYIFSGPNAQGVRSYTLVESYGTFCETAGPGTGSVLIAHGTATLSGATVTLAIESWVCASGSRGVFEPPLVGLGTLAGGGLDLTYAVAVRVGT
jgi:hypothetical protein